VFRYGSYKIGLNSCTFSISSYIIIFSFPSRYFFAIGLYIIFSFRCLYHLFILHYQTILLFHYIFLPWAITTYCSSFHRILESLYTNPLLPLELFLVRSPLLKKSKFVSSPVLNDMLKLRTYSYISVSLQTHDIHHVYRILYVGLRL